MTESEGPVPVTALPGARGAARAWRRGGQLHVTVVVKGTFTLTSDPMEPAAPAPISAGEVPVPDGVGLASAGDLAPYLALADVLVTGHVRLAGGAYETTFNLALLRDGEPLLQKSVDLERPPSGEPLVRLRGMGPVSRDWPLRRRLFGAAPPDALDRPVAELPDDLDWSCFQAAPLDQRAPWLRGDETLVLGGFDPDHPFLDAGLPAARAEARVHHAGGDPRGQPLALALDTLHVDLDARTCSLVWRGYLPVPDPRALGRMHIVVGMATAGLPLDHTAPFAAPRPAAEPPPPSGTPSETAAGEEESPFAGTLVLAGSAPVAPALPFGPPSVAFAPPPVTFAPPAAITPVAEPEPPPLPPPPAEEPQENPGFGESFLRAMIDHDPALRTALE